MYGLCRPHPHGSLLGADARTPSYGATLISWLSEHKVTPSSTRYMVVYLANPWGSHFPWSKLWWKLMSLRWRARGLNVLKEKRDARCQYNLLSHMIFWVVVIGSTYLQCLGFCEVISTLFQQRSNKPLSSPVLCMSCAWCMQIYTPYLVGGATVRELCTLPLNWLMLHQNNIQPISEQS